MHLSEKYNDPRCRQLANQYQVDQYGNPVFRNGHMMPFGISFVQETTVFREFGPVAGNTLQVTFEASPPVSDTGCQRQTIDVDLRHYKRLVANGVLAMRLQGLQELGPQSGLHVLRRQLRDARLRLPRSSSARRRSSPTPSCGSR